MDSPIKQALLVNYTLVGSVPLKMHTISGKSHTDVIQRCTQFSHGSTFSSFDFSKHCPGLPFMQFLTTWSGIIMFVNKL